MENFGDQSGAKNPTHVEQPLHGNYHQMPRFNDTGSFTRTDEKYHDTAAEQGFSECWVGF